MKINTIHLVYYSPTYSTRTILRSIASGLTYQTLIEHDLTQGEFEGNTFKPDEMLLVGMPVYAGRIPSGAVAFLNQFKGDHSPAITVCVYGNRNYDDALLELKSITESNGFKVVSAGAFVAQHCIFPEVANGRPDLKDLQKAEKFGQKNRDFLLPIADISKLPEIQVKGHFPYKIPGKIPLTPQGNRKCNQCNICVRLCPAQAINEINPRKTDKEKCISCARCIKVCPQKARHFGGLLYTLAGHSFAKKNKERREPELFFAAPEE